MVLPGGGGENSIICLFQVLEAACIPWMMAPHCLTSASIVTSLFSLSHFCLLLTKPMSNCFMHPTWAGDLFHPR